MVQAAYDQDQMDPEEEAYMMQQQMAMQQQQEMYQDEYGQEMMHQMQQPYGEQSDATNALVSVPFKFNFAQIGALSISHEIKSIEVRAEIWSNLNRGALFCLKSNSNLAINW